jgi:hypothetical protein
MSRMDDAATICLSERNLRHLLADPVAPAAWYAEKRIDFLEYKIERARERLAALEAELAQAKEEWSAIQAGDAEPKQTDECLARFAKDQCQRYRAENEAELVAERNLIDAALELTGLTDRGWLAGDMKSNDWCEYIVLARARSQPRRRNNPKSVLESLWAGVTAFDQARTAGESPDRCARAARDAYDAKLGDLGSLGPVENNPALFAVEAYRAVKVEGHYKAHLPRREWEPKAWDAFRAVLVNETARATAPPN